jgi:hypothetical protein
MTTFETVVGVRRIAPRIKLWLMLPPLLLIAGVLLRYGAYTMVSEDHHFSAFVQNLCTWDCSWYIQLAEHGYNLAPENYPPIDSLNWAFFPLYPLLIAIGTAILPMPAIWMATFLSLLFICAAVMLAWPLFERDRRGYILFCVMVLAGPFSVYFSTGYSESLFMLLTVALFVLLQRSNYVGAGLVTALMSVTRVVGVLAVFAILLTAISDHFKSGGSWRTFLRELPKNTDLGLALLVAPLGLFIFMAYMHFAVGDALAFSHMQRSWGRNFSDPFHYLWMALQSSPPPGLNALTTGEQNLAAISIIGLALSGVLAWRRQTPAAIFCLFCIIAPLTSGVASMLRFIAALAPLNVLVARMLGQSRVAFYAALIVMPLLDMLCTVGWLSGFGILV